MPLSYPDIYTPTQLTTVLNNGDVMYGDISRSGLFPSTPTGLDGRFILIDEVERGQLRVATAHAMGARGDTIDRGSYKTRAIKVPHFPAFDHVNANDVVGIREPGTDRLQALAPHVARVMDSHRQRFEITREWLMAHAIRGIVVDGSGQVMFDPWTEFGITQESVVVNTSADLQATGIDISRTVEDALTDDAMSSVEAWCSRTFFDALMTNTSFKDAYKYTESSRTMFVEDLRKVGITFGGIRYREYSGQLRDATGALTRLIPEGEAIAVPRGTLNVFKYYAAPADFNDTINLPAAQPFYAKMQETDFQRGYDIHSQANILPICLRPKALVKLTLV